MDKPLITFAIITYNHEKYFREAIEGALSQTYSPLEIIISDDCSTDKTFEIIKDTTSNYDGPHRIYLNRNDENQGIGGNINRVMEMAQGELIVIAAGDDISLPERTGKIWQAYRDSDYSAMSIFSSRMVIAEDGSRLGVHKRKFDSDVNDLEYLLHHNCGGLFGCSHAWHRSVFQVFGGMLKETISEDRVIPFRSAMLGKIAYIDDPLVLYRTHANNLSSKISHLSSKEELVAYASSNYKKQLCILQNYERDLGIENELIVVAPETREKLRAYAAKQILLYQYEIEFIEGDVLRRVRIIAKGGIQGVGIVKISMWTVRLLFPQIYIYFLRKKLSRNRFSNLLPVGLHECEDKGNDGI